MKVPGQKSCVGGGICKWMFLFQEYDFEVIVKPRRLNEGPNHLLHIETREEHTNLEEGLPDMHLFVVHVVDNHFTDIIHLLTMGKTLEGYMSQNKKELVVHAK